MTDKNKMKQEMVLITGGAGYIGSHVVRELLERGQDVLVVDDLSAGNEEIINFFLQIYGPQRFVFRKEDLLDRQNLNSSFRQILRKYRIKGIIDFASRIAVGESQQKPWDYFRTNVIGFKNLLMASGSVPVVKSSTAAVYGSPLQKDIPLHEDLLDVIVREERFVASQLKPASVSFGKLIDWYGREISAEYPFLKLNKEDIRYLFIPTNVYGITKLMDEIILRKVEARTGRKHIALRYFNAAGASPTGLLGEDHYPETHLIPIVLQAAMGKRKNINVFGSDYNTKDGTCVRDYISVSDLADVHILALEHLCKGGRGRVFNVGSNSGYTVKEIIDLSEKVTGCSIPVVVGERREGDPDALVASDALIKKKFRWKARHGIKDIIVSAWNWHRLNPEGFHMLREQRYSPFWDKWINVVASRQLRPWGGGEEDIKEKALPGYVRDCYLCPGNTRVSGRKNPSYKNTFVFPNDFPTFAMDSSFTQVQDGPYGARGAGGICEVMAYSPKHNDRFSEMSAGRLQKIIDLWIETYRRLSRKKGIKYVLLFENRGEVMGNSQLHPHGQVYASSSIPDMLVSPQIKKFSSYRKKTGRCFVCDSVKAERNDGRRILAESGSFVAFTPFAPMFPYEVMIVPSRHIGVLSQMKKDEKKDLAKTLKTILSAMDKVFGSPYHYSLAVIQSPVGTEGRGFHFQIYITSFLIGNNVKKYVVGYDIFGDMINPTCPEWIAEKIRYSMRSGK